MQQNTREGQKENGIVDTWWYKYLLKGVGTLGGLRKLLESAVNMVRIFSTHSSRIYTLLIF